LIVFFLFLAFSGQKWRFTDDNSEKNAEKGLK